MRDWWCDRTGAHEWCDRAGACEWCDGVDDARGPIPSGVRNGVGLLSCCTGPVALKRA